MFEEEGTFAEPGADIEKTESQEENLTLTQKIARLTTKPVLPSIEPTPTKKETSLPINPHGGKEGITVCEFCGSPRINSDPTGITCGKSQCLLELGRRWKEGEIESDTLNDVVCSLKEVAAKLEIDNKTLSDDAEEICEKIKEKVEPIGCSFQHLKETAKNLGLDELHTGDTAEDIRDQIEKIINNLEAELTSAAESLGLNPATLPENIAEVCQLIAKESSAVKNAVEEKLEEQQEEQNEKAD